MTPKPTNIMEAIEQAARNRAADQTPPPCSCSPEQYGLSNSLFHHAAAAGVAHTILEDRDRGWHTLDKTWRHLRFHLNGGAR